MPTNKEFVDRWRNLIHKTILYPDQFNSQNEDIVNEFKELLGLNEPGTGSVVKVVDTISANTSSKEYTLSRAPITDGETVSLNGIILVKTIDYTLSGVTLTINHAMIAGDIVQIKFF